MVCVIFGFIDNLKGDGWFWMVDFLVIFVLCFGVLWVVWVYWLVFCVVFDYYWFVCLFMGCFVGVVCVVEVL